MTVEFFQRAGRQRLAAFTLIAALVLLALARPVDHDESQYVAAATLTAHGLLPYRDYAYLQTPLQPLLFAPLARIAGAWTWPLLRILNALLGALAILSVWRAARIGGAGARAATIAAALFAACDILLFSIGTARNDALPVACLALALPAILRTARGDAGRRDAIAIGLLLASAAAAKISYALPALAYGAWTLAGAQRRPWWTLAGALPLALLIGWLWRLSPAGFAFGVFRFPALAPAEWYAARPWKLSIAAKAIDTLKFLALGPALLALVVNARSRRTATVIPGSTRAPGPGAASVVALGPDVRQDDGFGDGRKDPTGGKTRFVLDLLILAGIAAALAPSPTWRQYLLPILPPLFVRLALVWHAQPPRKAMRIAAIVFACAGLAPSVEAIGGAAIGGVPMADALRQSAAIRTAFDREGITGPVATLSPQFLPATGRPIDPLFATGPFYFRSTALLDDAQERRVRVVSHRRPATMGLPPAILTGGEGAWTSGDARIDAALAAYAIRNGYAAIPAGRFTLYRARRASPPPAPHNNP